MKKMTLRELVRHRKPGVLTNEDRTARALFPNELCQVGYARSDRQVSMALTQLVEEDMSALV